MTSFPRLLFNGNAIIDMSDRTIRYPELSDDLRSGPSWRMFGYFGAGAIIASVTIGSGETLFASKGGAIFGYTLLWCFIGSAITKAIQVYTSARYMTLTGQHPMSHWAYLPGPHGWVPLLIGLLSIACFPFFLSGLPLMIGKTMNWIVGIEATHDRLLMYGRIWGTAFIVAAATLTWLQSYGVLERVQTVIVGILLLCVFSACIATGFDLQQLLLGSFVPTIPVYPEWMLKSSNLDIKEIVAQPAWAWVGLFLGAVGGGTYDYIGYIGCFREKKWGAIGLADINESVGSMDDDKLPIDLSEENIRRGRGWLWPAKIDVGIGFLCVLVFTVCFVVLGAEILHPNHLVPSGHNLLTHQATFLTRLHPALLYVYQVGILVAFWGTIYGAYEIYLRTARECLLPLSATIRRMPEDTFRTLTILYCALSGLIGCNLPEALITRQFSRCFCHLLGKVANCRDRHFSKRPCRLPPNSCLTVSCEA